MAKAFRDMPQTSRSKFDRLRCATAGFTTGGLDGYGLRSHLPARRPPYASDPVFVHQLASLLRASFRPRLTASAISPLRFAITSRPSRCEEDLHLLAVKHARHTGKRTDKNVSPTSMRRSLLASRTVEPKIDRFFHFGRRLVWQRDLAAFASGRIGGINGAKHDQAIFARSLRSLFAAHAVREVGQFLRCAVIPEFLENGIRPTFRCGSFFDCVAVSAFTVGLQRIAHVEIGVRAASFAEDFDAVVHPAAPRPAIFHQSDRTIGEFENA